MFCSKRDVLLGWILVFPLRKCIIGAVREVLLKLTKPLAKIVRRRIFYAELLSVLNFSV